MTHTEIGNGIDPRKSCSHKNTVPKIRKLVCAMRHMVSTSPAKNVKCWRSVLPFQPNYRFGHLESYLFSLTRNMLTGSKYPKINWSNFDKHFTAGDVQVSGRSGYDQCCRFGRSIAQVTRKNKFMLREVKILGKSSPKMFNSFLKTKSLVMILSPRYI